VVTGWIGGHAGRFIADGLQAEGIQTDFIHTEFESRTCLSILDPQNNTLTELYEKGDPIPIEKVDEFTQHFAATVKRYAAITFSGSLPPGVPLDFYRQLIQIARDAQVSTILDSSGEALHLGLQARPTLVKPNEKEFVELAGRALNDRVEFAQAASEFAERYQTSIVISLGAEGALAASQHEVWHVCPPQLMIKSAVGSGDSTVAGIAYGLTHGCAFEEAIKYGVAAGTANALSMGAGVFTVDDFQRVLSQVSIARAG
jgi:tagatose 6-phosphate kinase